MKFITGLLTLITAALLGGPIPAYGAVIEVGDNVPEFCWTDLNDAKVCSAMFVNNVRVLIYGTGWCPDCNKEMQEIVQRFNQIKDKAVTFISLSAQGDLQGAPPTSEFLKSWKERHAIPFLVAASPRDAGRHFFAPPIYIPNVVIIGRDNRLVFKAVSPKVEQIFAEVNKALGE